MKATIIAIALGLCVEAASFAQQEEEPRHPHRGPRLTEEQRNCLDAQVGAPDSGKRPTREQMDDAFTACGIGHPSMPPRDCASVDQ